MVHGVNGAVTGNVAGRVDVVRRQEGDFATTLNLIIMAFPVLDPPFRQQAVILIHANHVSSNFIFSKMCNRDRVICFT